MAQAQQTKKLTKEEKDSCRLITCRFRASYVHLDKPHAVKAGDKETFGITMLLPKDQDLTGKTLDGQSRTFQQAMKNAKLITFGPKENWPEGLESPISDGDAPQYKDNDGYKGHWIIKATSNADNQPGVADEDGVPMDPKKLYSGCYARAYVFARVWTWGKKQGVHFILDHVQKLADGKPFGGKTAIENVFGPVGTGKAKLDEEEDDDMDFK